MSEARRVHDLTGAERAVVLTRAADAVLAHLGDGPTRPVSPSLTDAEIDARLGALDFETPLAPERALAELVALLRDGIVNTGHPGYFGLFNPRPAFMGVAGDLLTAAFNPQLAATSHAPAIVELERRLIATFARWVGLPGDAGGCFTSGGAEANHTGLLIALDRALPGLADQGLRSAPGRPVLYASADAHLAWLKIAHATGLGRAAVRLVAVDEHGRMDAGVLHRAVREDRAAGRLPFLVVGTFGTTSTGACDPLPALADLCAAEDLHFHVDAAWGGAICVSEALRPLLAGCERADSVTVDAHKWLSAPMGAGMLLTPHQDTLAHTFGVSTGYMPAPSDIAPDPYATTLQWSRRAIGIKVALTLLTAGRGGHARVIEEDCRLGDALRDRLRAGGWRVVNHSGLPLVCCVDAAREDDGARHQRIADDVVRGGRAWISTVTVAGRTALRACVISHATAAADLDELVDELDRCRGADQVTRT